LNASVCCHIPDTKWMYGSLESMLAELRTFIYFLLAMTVFVALLN